MTFGDVEIKERQVCIVLRHRVCVVLERGRRVRMTQLVGDPLDVLSGLKCPCCPGVAGRVKRQFPYPRSHCPTAHSLPDSRHVPRYRCGSSLAAEHPIGCLRPAVRDAALLSQGKQVEELIGESARHNDPASLPTLRRRLALRTDRSTDEDLLVVKVHVLPLEPKRLASPHTCRKHEFKQWGEPRLMSPGDLQQRRCF
ncbi:MAG: hypothetical protein QMB94_13505 [Phycisphaerales bacterium]